MSPIYKKLLLLSSFTTLIYLFYLTLRWGTSSIRIVYENPEDDDCGQIEQHGNYWIWHNYIHAEAEFTGNSSITITTHGSYQDIAMLPMLINRWRGPISLTLYTSGNDFDKAIESLGYINRCTEIGHLLRRYVSVHLCFHQNFVPTGLRRVSFWYTPTPFICSLDPIFVGTQSNTFWFEHGLNYPINLLRNVARLNALTYFVMPIDIELLPTRNFTTNFFQFLEDSWPNRQHKESLYCFLTFKHDYVSPVPYNKRQLLEVLQKSNISRESHYDDRDLQSEWLESNNSLEDISIFSIRHKKDACVAYVSVNTVEPLYDERYEFESVYYGNKNLKSLVLEYLKYSYVILDGTFLVRRDRGSWHNVQLFNQESISNNKLRYECFFVWKRFYEFLWHDKVE